MQFHTANFLGRSLFPHGYLAVDFFFMLSGFVLTFAYQTKLDAGWSMASFMKARLIRLYPLYLLGLGMGFVFRLLQHRIGAIDSSLSNLVAVLFLGLFFLPAPPSLTIAGPASFPYDVPTWSLFYELAANIFHALFLKRRGWTFLVITMVISGSVLIYSAAKFETMDFGWTWHQTLLGLFRVTFSYTMGMSLFRLWKSGRMRVQVSPILPALVLLAFLAVPTPQHLVASYDLLVTICLFPLLLLISASSIPGRPLVQVSRALGTISYALYVLHAPVALYCRRLWLGATGHAIERDAPWAAIVYTVIILALALLIDRFYDLPVRAFLRDRLSGNKKQLTFG